eukprot:2521223-Rhodomonas_salina.1
MEMQHNWRQSQHKWRQTGAGLHGLALRRKVGKLDPLDAPDNTSVLDGCSIYHQYRTLRRRCLWQQERELAYLVLENPIDYVLDRPVCYASYQALRHPGSTMHDVSEPHL